MSDPTISELSNQAMAIARRYRAVGAQKGQPDWSARDYAEGFTKDLGDLVKLLMVKDNLRDGDGDVDAQLAHELSDCLWSVLVIAHELGIDMADAFGKTMRELDERLKQEESI